MCGHGVLAKTHPLGAWHLDALRGGLGEAHEVPAADDINEITGLYASIRPVDVYVATRCACAVSKPVLGEVRA